MEISERRRRADELEKIALIIRMMARAVRGGSDIRGSREAQEAIELLARYLDTGETEATT